MVANLGDSAQTLLDAVRDALIAAERPVGKVYQSMGVPVIGICCEDQDDQDVTLNGELSIHFQRLFDADPQSLVEVQRTRPCKNGAIAASYRMVLARCRPTMDEHGELPEPAERTETTLEQHQDLELLWQALATAGPYLRIDDVSADLAPSGNCSLVYADITILVCVPPIPEVA